MTTPHTPGPWHYIVIENKYHDDNGKMVTVATVLNAAQLAIARCHKVEDAAFIAAAPDMAEALKWLLEVYVDVCDIEISNVHPETAAGKARAALAKAGVA